MVIKCYDGHEEVVSGFDMYVFGGEDMIDSIKDEIDFEFEKYKDIREIHLDLIAMGDHRKCTDVYVTSKECAQQIIRDDIYRIRRLILEYPT